MNHTIFLGISITLCMTFTSVSAMAANTVVVVPLGSAKGNAVKSDVLRDKTFSNSTSKGITGTRPPAPIAKTGATASVYAGDDFSYASTYGESVTPRCNDWSLLGFGIYDRVTGLSWEHNPPSSTYNVNNAIDRCEAKITGFGGLFHFDDWRLPNLNELLSFIDRGRINPALACNDMITLPLNTWFWTSTPYAVGTTAWMVQLAGGTLAIDPRAQPHYTMCVRGGLSHSP